MMTRRFAIVAALGLMAMLASQIRAYSQGAVVYGGYGYYGAPAYGAVVYSPPLYPAYGAVVYSPPLYPAYGPVVYSPPAYVAPAPVAYGVYPPVAPIGYAPVYPRNGLEIEYKYKRGLWYVEIDD
jgi:hypothetical protein